MLWSRASAPSALARDADLLRDDAAAMAPSPTLLIDDPIVSAIADDSRRNAKVQRDRPTAVAVYPAGDECSANSCLTYGYNLAINPKNKKQPVDSALLGN